MLTQTDQILNLIRGSGPEGAPNYKLSDIALQYNFHIHKLRKDGFDIRKRRAAALHDGKQSQTFYYYLVGAQGSSPVRAAKVDDLEPPVEKHTSVGHYMYKGRSTGTEDYQTGQFYDLTIGKLEIGQPIRVIAPKERTYPDLNHFNKMWGVPK